MLTASFKVGDVARLKKSHPCGSCLWLITRVGMDIGLQCRGCGHYVLLPRSKFLKAAKAIEEPGQEE